MRTQEQPEKYGLIYVEHPAEDVLLILLLSERVVTGCTF
jgi:hypothetical protein